MIDEKTTFNMQCKGATKAGERCRRNVTFLNGFCAAHGGMNPPEKIKEWNEYKQRKARRRIDRLRASAARWNRKHAALLKEIKDSIAKKRAGNA